MQHIPKLSILYLYVTDKCNLFCAHCWIDGDTQKNKFIKIEQLDEILDTMLALGLKQVNITGGEPLLHPDIVHIIRLFCDRKVTVYLNTNGILLSEAMCNQLKKCIPYLFCAVSLDGAYAITHDAIRGCSGAYDKTLCGIKGLIKQGLPCELIFTIQKRNQDELRKVISIADELQMNTIRINFLQYSSGKRINELLSTEGKFSALDIMEVNGTIRDLNKESNIKITTNLPFSFYLPKEIQDMRQRVCGIKHAIGILPDGTISLCGVGELKPELNMGNIATDSIEQIWINNKIIQYIRNALPQRFEGVCRNCILREICCGYCVAENYMESAKLNTSYNLCEELYANNLFPSRYLEKSKK